MKVTQSVVVAMMMGGCGDPLPPAPGRGLRCADTTDVSPPGRLAVIASDYASGEASAVQLSTLSSIALPVYTAPGAMPHVSGDTLVRTLGATLVLLDRSRDVGDSATYFDVSTTPPTLLAQTGLVSPGEIRGGTGVRPYANAHDVIAADGCRAYIARWSLASLAVVALDGGAVVSTVDLSMYRGRASTSNPDALARVGNEVWVTLERLDDLLAPTQHGMVLRLDPTHDTVVGAVELPVANPVGPLLPAPGRPGLVVAAPGDYHHLGDGGVVWVTSDGVMHPLLVREDDPAVMGNIDAVAVLDTHTLLLKVTGIEQTDVVSALPTRLIAYDLTTGTGQEWARWSLWNPAVPVVVGRRVYMGDPGDLRHGGAGVRVFGTDGREITTSAIPVRSGLFPYDLHAMP